MSRYIDAEKFEKAIIGMAYVGNKGKIVFDTDFIFNTLYQQPTAEVQEVKHGKWEKRCLGSYLSGGVREEWHNYYCSECDKPQLRPSKYCPKCGAKMDKGEQ